jgi:uncharacterized integral membrane protein
VKIFSLILLIIFAFFIVTFSLENSTFVNVHYYHFFSVVVPIYMLVFISLLVGVIITGFIGVVERFRLNRTISRLNKTIRDMRKEIRSNEPPPIIEEPKVPLQS